ncbi:hypothetical protein BBK36DRAFT_1199995 [Trichoderma citrinoviride]|uniref:Uncharacterized protein n=1 Tax=Trichoderma citrinoviride TaxID=58853 RepID=A0A2T4BDF0_9HYPO|nr:hypothetical protein BBK36DRAFT_1199995 [Trichoderma citrinoviride]PTB67219.1 hypothetical protein BBK36DRAFT_1199995 [Trichoderma citrinoviride]
MPESEMASVAQPADGGAAPTKEPAESHAAEKATGSTQASAGRASARYASATATSTVARTGARTSATVNKPTRSSTSVHRSTASTSNIGHRSAPSVGGADDDQKPTARSARRESAIVTGSAGVGADKKTGPSASAVAARRSTVGVGAASPKPVAQRAKPGTSDSPSATRAAGVTRGTASSNAAADARKRPSAPSIVTSASRPSTRTSVRSEAHIDSPKLLDELTSKLADKDKEIESLKVELTSFETTVAELRHKLEGDGQQADDESKAEQQDAPDDPKTDYDAIIRDLEAQLLEKAEKLRAVDAELAEAVRGKDQGGEALDSLQKELESLRLESQEKLKATEDQYEQTIRDYAAQVEKLQASVSDQSESDTAAADLRSTLEATVQSLQQQVDELTASKNELESIIESVKSERDALTGKLSDLENEILEFKSRLAASEEAIKTAEANAESDRALATKIQGDLAQRDAELESARKAETELQGTIADLKATLSAKDDEVSGLKAMHDERLKQVSQDYENEIESLRGDAFFKRRFEELEKQHNELQTAMAEDSEKHTKALAESEEGRLQAVNALKAKESEHEEQLASIRSLHTQELTAAKSEALDVQAKELDSIKAQYEEKLRLALADGEASSAEYSKTLQTSHEKLMEDLKRVHEEERQQLLATHESHAAAIANQHASELAALRKELEEATTQLESTKSASQEELESLKRELQATHAAEVEKVAAAHTEATNTLKEEGLRVRQQLEDLMAAHKQLEAALEDSKAKNASLEEQLSLQADTNAALEASLKAAQEQMVAVQAEADDVGQQLALEKLERMTALAELDAVKRPDAAAINNLRAELAATTKTFQDSLAAAKADLQACQAELKTARDDFYRMEEKMQSQIKEKTAQADYNDLNDSMTALLEEANKKVKESEMSAQQLLKKLEDADDRYEHLLAQLKIKDAELAEAEAQAALYKSNRAVNANAAGDAAEGEEENDHSSTALALLSKVRLTAKQVDTLDREMRDRNLQLLNSITDVKLSS